MGYFTKRELEAKMNNFGNDFRNVVSTWYFGADYHIMVFNTILQDCHGIVGGLLLDHR